MKRFPVALVVAGLLFAAGCGKPDLNKDLKPIDPNAPRPATIEATSPGAGEAEQVKAPGAPL